MKIRRFIRKRRRAELKRRLDANNTLRSLPHYDGVHLIVEDSTGRLHCLVTEDENADQNKG